MSFPSRLWLAAKYYTDDTAIFLLSSETSQLLIQTIGRNLQAVQNLCFAVTIRIYGQSCHLLELLLLPTIFSPLLLIFSQKIVSIISRLHLLVHIFNQQCRTFSELSCIRKKTHHQRLKTTFFVIWTKKRHFLKLKSFPNLFIWHNRFFHLHIFFKKLGVPVNKCSWGQLKITTASLAKHWRTGGLSNPQREASCTYFVLHKR